MTNRAFSLKSDVGKQKKLSIILRERTNDALTESEIQAILASLPPDQQYSIFVHNTPGSFTEALVLVKTEERCDYGEILFGQASFCVSNKDSSGNGQLLAVHDSAAAIVVRKTGHFKDTKAAYALHIYIPRHIEGKRKVAEYEKRLQTETSV